MKTVFSYGAEALLTLTDLFENSLPGLHIVGPDGLIRRANHADMELLGYGESPEEYLGHHVSEFHAEREAVEHMLEGLAHDRPLVNYHAQLVARDGSRRPVLIDSNSRMDGTTFLNTRCFTRPHDDARAWSAPRRGRSRAELVEQLDALSEDEKCLRFDELNDFFENAVVGMHVVGPDGVIRWANRAELAFMGYADRPGDYIDHHVAEFHADPEVIDEMLERLLNDEPLRNHPARLTGSGRRLRSVVIYSNSRFDGGQFVNTRCFTFPAAQAAAPDAGRFSWPGSDGR